MSEPNFESFKKVIAAYAESEREATRENQRLSGIAKQRLETINLMQSELNAVREALRVLQDKEAKNEAAVYPEAFGDWKWLRDEHLPIKVLTLLEVAHHVEASERNNSGQPRTALSLAKWLRSEAERLHHLKPESGESKNRTEPKQQTVIRLQYVDDRDWWIERYKELNRETDELRAWKESALEQMKQWDEVVTAAQLAWPRENANLWGQPIQPYIVKVLREHVEAKAILAKGVNRDVTDETLVQLANIATNGLYWRGEAQRRVEAILADIRFKERAKPSAVPTAWLESQEFYNLCMYYRSAPIVPQDQVRKRFHDLIAYIRKQIEGAK